MSFFIDRCAAKKRWPCRRWNTRLASPAGHRGRAAPLIKKKAFVEAAAGILAVEAYHMGMARSQLYRRGEKAWKAANALSDARGEVGGGFHPQGMNGTIKST